MRYRDILKVLAPCGLNCYKCFAYKDGEIRKVSLKLKELMGSFDKYAERFSKFLPVFENYPAFKELLIYLTEGDCKGCREGTCKYPDCGVIEYYKKKGIDFCFQCDEFPCNKTNFDPDLKRRWIKMNKRMQEVGVEAYFAETRNRPRYIHGERDFP
ncbi:MAG: DUF3795 domain-containing protein [Candidatus Aminicenantes bacterium]|uniref:DUF3795 domain-containing protein n=1 Tax=candidate division WOR-3 bacterium TaxID=2052148 RepID=A0A7V0LUN1_UNCW3|nr:MAG: DUF3795 domain-containing protein [Candidatus Aminicenantes bacterium]HDL60592.1 DUF3795 domain-containing protein [candidate division WOR-3 bacterium]